MASRSSAFFLLILVSSVKSTLLSSVRYGLQETKIILPQSVTGLTVQRSISQQSPTMTVTSVYNETRGSTNHPFACFDRPDFFSSQKRKWTAGTKQLFELDCWTRPISQSQSAANQWGPMMCMDNMMSWFRSTKEGCWFPDYVVQKDAVYGLSQGSGGPPFGPWAWFGKGASGNTGTAAKGATGATAAKGGSTAKVGPPWMQGGGPPWLQGGAGPKPEDDLRNKLRYCPPPIHQIGTFRDQYQGQTYCYSCTRLDCANKKVLQVAATNNIELSCWILGNEIEQDQTWWKLKGDECFIPNQVFDPSAFQGNAAECLKKY